MPVFCLNQSIYLPKLEKITPTGCFQVIGTREEKPPSKTRKSVNREFDMAAQKADALFAGRIKKKNWLTKRPLSILFSLFFHFLLDFIT